LTRRRAEPAPQSVRDGIIREVVSQIPRGKVATYGEVARLSGFIGQARLVGHALHRLPPNSRIPWQRVVNAKGEISLPKQTGQYQRQKRLLEQEGIRFRRGRIDFKAYGWIFSMESEVRKRG
jgi:methylated-DNA-protein-cysteine methyltransferase related protein